jgi:hypothetical protein
MTLYQIMFTDGRGPLDNTFTSMTEALLFALLDLRLEAADFEIKPLVGERR